MQNIKHDTESIIAEFDKGEAELRKKHAQREIDKLGDLRGGNAACLLPDGSVIGAEPNATLARYLGHQLPCEASQGYFDGGINNEIMWETNIIASGIPFKCEEDIPVKVDLDNTGQLITGRPDMVLGRYEGKKFIPERGIELKAIQACNSAGNKLWLEEPDCKHLIQAGTYSMFMGIPFTLVYTSNVSGGITNFFTKKNSGRYEAAFGKIEFPIGWDEGKMYYMTPQGDRVDTLVTQEGILDFYRGITEMAATKQIGVMKQADVYITGKPKPYNPNEYSDLDLLASPNQTWDNWLASVKIACNQKFLIKHSKKKYHVVEPVVVKEPHKTWKEDIIHESFKTYDEAFEYWKRCY